MRTFRTLRADEIECRISEVSKQGKYLKLLLYKTARTDAALLDEVFGAFNWKCDYRDIDGKMYCGIGIYDDQIKEWIWKWNVGSESNMEAEKGQASDALKRAGFVWGLGAELYTAPQIVVWADKCDIKAGDKPKCYDKFIVKEIEYDAQENISKLVIWNETQRMSAFEWEKGKAVVVPAAEPAKATPPASESFTPVCKDCRKTITDAEHDYSVKNYGKPLCRNCQKNNSRIR